MDGYNTQAIINNNGKTCINTLSEQFQNHIDNHGSEAKSMPLAHTSMKSGKSFQRSDYSAMPYIFSQNG
jgi:flavin reductase (DIM6/NTAB) family NADH-FMN oxidoreductase RutF